MVGPVFSLTSQVTSHKGKRSRAQSVYITDAVFSLLLLLPLNHFNVFSLSLSLLWAAEIVSESLCLLPLSKRRGMSFDFRGNCQALLWLVGVSADSLLRRRGAVRLLGRGRVRRTAFEHRRDVESLAVRGGGEGKQTSTNTTWDTSGLWHVDALRWTKQGRWGILTTQYAVRAPCTYPVSTSDGWCL